MSRMKLYFFYRRSVLIFIYTRPVAGRSTIFPMFLPLSFPYCIWYNGNKPKACCWEAFFRGAAPPVLSARRRLPFPVLQRLNLQAYWLLLESFLSGRSPCAIA